MSNSPAQEETFNRLYEKYHASIFHLCMGIVHDEMLAQDLTQEAFVSAFRHFGELRDVTKLSSWLKSIARNLSITALKEKKGVAFREELATSPSKGTEEILEEEEEREAIEKAKETLPPKQREVFELYDLEKLSHKEIASRLGIPDGTCRSRLHYARKKVREYLLSHYFKKE